MHNLGEFKRLYAEFYCKSLGKRSKPLCPFFVQVGRKYHDASPKCLFVGKATNGWVSTSEDADVLFDPEHRERIVNLGDEMAWVDCKSENYNPRNSAFWRVIKATTKKLLPHDDWYAYIAWSNVYKFAPDGENPDESLKKLQRDICCKILDKEIEFLKPNFVVFLTSGWEWFYAEHIGLKTENEKKWGKYKAHYQKDGGITYIQSKHPQGKKEEPHVIALLEIINGKL